MTFDPLYYPYPSRRSVVCARRGMVATTQPLAAQAGLDMLKRGGNAVDAAIATAACLTVVEPTSNGIGGDAFALVWTAGRLHGLNASGPASQGISAEQLRRAGHKIMPKRGWATVNVPGAPAAWAELSARFGRLPLTEVLEPAAEYAERGFAVTPVISGLWSEQEKDFTALTGEEFQYWFETFAPKGRTPSCGEIWSSPAHARTLRQIAATAAEAFYRGEIADKIDAFSQRYGGYLRASDLAAYRPEWVTPVSINYRGYDVWEIPPNGHGLVALMALNILKGFEFSAKESVETYHGQFEAMKLAFVDGRQYIADPRMMNVSVSTLLSEAYAAERRAKIGTLALEPVPGRPPSGGTVYLATADEAGNMVSYIQSNYSGFGSGLVVPGTGIALHNRGNNFSLDPDHVNCLAPGKKPYHTIIPGFLTKNGEAVGPFGVMGGFVQPQGHVQMVMNTVDFALNPQAALDAPRWQWKEGRVIEVEHSFPEALAEALQRKGHIIRRAVGNTAMGRGQIIWRDNQGVLTGGTEPRADGGIAVW
ncbi:MAG TPA: gamma-glutamyltransferase family protein [Patescibacteria group bacterium]|nr:gamma-glutamyltransferase family protein [Patescibacteria group bacterium]